jgi:hypothetical protein
MGLAGWSYWRLRGSKKARVILSALRTSIILLLVFLITAPQVTFPRESIERDIVIAMVDRSSSMNITDVPGPIGRISREQQLNNILEENAVVWDTIASQSELRWYGFASNPFTLPWNQTEDVVESKIPILERPDGWRTEINGSMEDLLDAMTGRSLSGIILFSDGRSSSVPARALMRTLRENSIPVFTIALGSTVPVSDIGIIEVDHPTKVFVKDSVPIVLTCVMNGNDETGEVLFRLRDDVTDTILDERTLTIDSNDPRVLLTTTLDEAGLRKLRVELVAGEDDLIQSNNERLIEIEVIDRPIKVLYIEGYPRWEYRYLKNLLIRESSIESSIMLLSADLEFAQEGDLPLERLPRDQEELDQFDLLIIGDVPSGFFTDDQLEMFSENVSSRGMGLLWLGGERSTPSSWNSTPLEDLLPFTPPFALDEISGGVIVEPTMSASELGLFVIDPDSIDGWIPELSLRETGWSLLRSVQKIDDLQLKPTTEILARLIDEDGAIHPGVMMMRFGAGQIIYSAFDDIWRWRFGRGEELTDRWWVGLVRMMARQSIDSSDRALELSIDSKIASPGTPTTIRLQVFDESVSNDLDDLVIVSVKDMKGVEIAEVELVREDKSSEWSSEWTPLVEGEFRLEIEGRGTPGLSVEDMKSTIQVRTPDGEYRNLNPDHELLEAFSRETGGLVLPPGSLGELPEALPNRDVLIENPITASIWNSWFFFLLLLVLLVFEWTLRRALRMT